MTFQPGEIVDITIKGVRVIETFRHVAGKGDDLRFEYETPSYVAWPGAVWAQAPGVTVERVAPDEWPPRTGDLWRDGGGDLWFAVTDGGGRVSGLVFVMPSEDGVPSDPDRVNRDHGPLTLVHREDEQDGADRG